MGIAYAKEMAWRAHYVKDNLVKKKKELEKMVAERKKYSGGGCRRIERAALYAGAAYKNKKLTLAGDAFILSPFDALNVFRHRLKDFSRFRLPDRMFLCLPPKEKYGYFPARIDRRQLCSLAHGFKADRKQNQLIVHNLHFGTSEAHQYNARKFQGGIEGVCKVQSVP